MRTSRIAASVMSVALSLLVAFPLLAQLKSPDDVKRGLLLLVQVSNDFKRQINAKRFERVPHENMEYMEAAEAMRAAVKDEPAAFKTKVEARLKAAVAAYQKVSDMSSTTQDVDKLMAEHAKAVAEMNKLIDLFPADLHPDPNAAPGGRGRGGQAPAKP